MSLLNLPEPIAAYFDADRRDGKAIANCFTKQGVVRDEGQTYAGRDAIRAWKTAASAKYSYAIEPLAVEHKEGQHVVASRVTGNFPGSPVALRLVFRLQSRKIASLEIAP